jgi:hypothetical protein
MNFVFNGAGTEGKQKNHKPYSNYTILFVGIYALNDHAMVFYVSVLCFLPSQQKKNIFFLCELCALSKAGGEKILPLTHIAKLGPSA